MKPFEFVEETWQLLQSLIEESATELDSLGLYPRAVFLLSRIPELPYPAQLAESLNVPAPTVSFILRQFEKQGFISRQTEAKDLRRYRLTLTEKGSEALKRAKQIMDRCAGRRLERLAKDDLTKFATLLRELNREPVGKSGEEQP